MNADNLQLHISVLLCSHIILYGFSLLFVLDFFPYGNFLLFVHSSQCLRVTLAERSKFSEGEIQTFMSIDADRTVNLFNSLHDIWRLDLISWFPFKPYMCLYTM